MCVYVCVCDHISPPPAAGVGFSYADKSDELVDTEAEVGEDLYRFLQVR